MQRKCTVLVAAMMAIMMLSFVPNLAAASTSVEGPWASLDGSVQKYGNSPAFGWIEAIVGNRTANGTCQIKAMVNAMWTTGSFQPVCVLPGGNLTIKKPENFTFSFYSARLVEATMMNYSYTGHSLFINGTWDVFRWNFSYCIMSGYTSDLRNHTIVQEPILTNATGQLTVNATGATPTPDCQGWLAPRGTFTLAIAGISTVTGIVISYCCRHVEILIGDFYDEGKVDIKDLSLVAHHYGEMPGFGNYTLQYDVNCEYTIGIGDLTTIAASITP